MTGTHVTQAQKGHRTWIRTGVCNGGPVLSNWKIISGRSQCTHTTRTSPPSMGCWSFSGISHLLSDFSGLDVAIWITQDLHVDFILGTVPRFSYGTPGAELWPARGHRASNNSQRSGSDQPRQCETTTLGALLQMLGGHALECLELVPAFTAEIVIRWHGRPPQHATAARYQYRRKCHWLARIAPAPFYPWGQTGRRWPPRFPPVS